MIYLRRTFPITVVLLLTMAITACGGSTSSGSSSSTPAATATTASSSKAVVKTTTATVNGKAETILTNAQGKTLYHFTSDTATTSACTGTCTQTWHPLLVTSGAPTSATTLPGKLSAQTTANGNQVEYNGHLLYTYAGDSGPGQTNGEGLFGKWFVTTPNLK
jgi:predicted lipoprotein with Yx(FWY)xxD motif